MKVHWQILLKGSGCLLFFLCFVLICGLLGSLFTLLFNHLFPLPLAIALALLVLGGSTLFFLSPSLLPSAQRRYTMRKTALIGDRNQVSLANPQPVPDETALPLPWAIKVVPNWTSIGLIIGGIGLLTWLIIVGGLFMVGGPGALDGATLLFLALLIWGALGLVTVLDSPWIRETITLSEEGIQVHGFRKKRFINWKQVRLFASVSEGKAGTPVSEYELADLTTSLHVRRLRREARLQMLKPETTFEAYEQQMGSLLSFIAAKTGEPLYDLRP